MDSQASPFRVGYRVGTAFLCAGILIETFGTTVLSGLIRPSFDNGFNAQLVIWSLLPWIAFTLGLLGVAFVIITFGHQMAAATRRFQP